jgi:hypothetical protein
MKVVAIKMGFYGGTRIKPGTALDMPVAKGKKLPSWVVPANEAPKAVAPAPLNGDTKPVGAAAAAAQKRAEADTNSLA